MGSAVDGTNPSRVLIIEDDADLADVLVRGFREEGFAVDRCGDGASGLRAILAASHDLVILDIMLPGKDGLAICTEARAAGVTTPIVMLTVRASVQERVAGLRAGADDYVAKPFVFDELLARAHAQLRRANSYGGQLLKLADLELDLLTRRAERAGKRIELTAKEFSVLEYLMRRPGHVVTEEDILLSVWGIPFDPGTNIVRVYIHHLRSKLDREHERKLLCTVRGRGFRLGDAESG